MADRQIKELTKTLMLAREFFKDVGHYCEGRLQDLDGRVCLRGAVLYHGRIGNPDTLENFNHVMEYEADRILNKAAMELYKNGLDTYLVGAYGDQDMFHVYVNNNFGHEAALKVLDRAIQLSLDA